MPKVIQLILGVVALSFSFAASAITEEELQALDKFSFLPGTPRYSVNEEIFDFKTIGVTKKKYTPPLSLQETRNKIKQRLALQINSSWQIGLDSFKAAPIDRPIVDWAGPTQPKAGRTRSNKGYGVGVRMRI